MAEEHNPKNEPTLDFSEIVECPHCGFANLPNSNYWSRCGLSIFDTEQVEETPEPLPCRLSRMIDRQLGRRMRTAQDRQGCLRPAPGSEGVAGQR